MTVLKLVTNVNARLNVVNHSYQDLFLDNPGQTAEIGELWKTLTTLQHYKI